MALRKILLLTLATALAAILDPVAAQSVPTIESIAGGGPRDVPALGVAIFPEDLAVDGAGSIYFPSRFRHRVYKVDAGGILRLVAGTGIERGLGDNGPIERSSFLLPDKIALMPSGDLLVYGGGEAWGCCHPGADEFNRLDLQVRRLNFASGLVEHVVDFRGPLLWPEDLALAPDGRVFAATLFRFDSGNWEILGQIYEIDPVTGVTTLIAGEGYLPGPGWPLDDGKPATEVNFWRVPAVTVPSAGELVLTDFEHQRIRRVDLTTGIIDSHAPAAGLYGRVASDGTGNLYVMEESIVWRIDAATGSVSAVAGTGVPGFSGDGGPATDAEIIAHWITLDPAGNLYLAGDGSLPGSGRIRRVDHDTAIIQSVAGDPSADPFGDGGPATQAFVRLPVDVAPDPSGDLYIAEAGYTAVSKVDGATGVITSLFRGAYGDTGYSNGSPPSLTAVALREGSLYYTTKSTVRDLYGLIHEDAVFRYDLATGQTTQVAGVGWPDCIGEGEPASAAGIQHPRDLVFDAEGNLFIADAGNNQIRRVDAATGIITRVAGLTGSSWCAMIGGFNGDGLPALETQLNHPSGIALDAAGNLYIADTRNDRIRRVDAATGLVATVAGNGVRGSSGDGGLAVLAEIYYPRRVEVDGAGNLFIAEDERIRRVDAVSGIISTLAGDGMLGFHGDGGPAALAGLGDPRGMAFDAAGDLLVASWEAGRVRKIDLPVEITATATATPAVLWPPNHRMVAVHVDLDTGATPGPLTIELLSITSNEPDDAPGGGDGATLDDIRLADFGAADFDFELRAERSAGGAGRVYTIEYLVTDSYGFSTAATTFVTVPHDMGGIVDPVSLSIEETFSGTVISWEEIPGASSYSILRGEIDALADLLDLIDLGDVICVESRSRDLSTAGDEDAELPYPGRAFFYLGEYRDPHPRSYGSVFAPKPRAPASGACQ
jgi:sugar lactone lactonase YvrE